MVAATMVLGALAEIAAWRLVVARRLSVWAVMSLSLGPLGILAVLVRRRALSPAVSPWVAASAGAGAGVLLYLATRLVVHAIRGWRAFRRQAEDIYGQRGSLSLPTALALAGIMVIGEELFWRGLFQVQASRAAGRLGGATLTWAAFVGTNFASGNLAIIAGAVVGGAVWTGLAYWTHGVLSSVVCHSVWTGLMLAFPVVRLPAAASRGA